MDPSFDQYTHQPRGPLGSQVQLLDAGADSGFSLGPRVAVLTAAAQDLTRVKPFRGPVALGGRGVSKSWPTFW